MKKLRVVMICISFFGLSGCAQMMSITTTDEIRKSTYQLETISTKPANDVSNCMKEALIQYKSDDGKSSYAGITFRDFEKSHDIMLRSGASISLVGTEILFLIENSATPTGGTRSHIWAHPMILNNGGSQGYLDRVTSVVRPCLGTSVAAPEHTSSEASTPTSNATSQKLRDQ